MADMRKHGVSVVVQDAASPRLCAFGLAKQWHEEIRNLGAVRDVLRRSMTGDLPCRRNAAPTSQRCETIRPRSETERNTLNRNQSHVGGLHSSRLPELYRCERFRHLGNALSLGGMVRGSKQANSVSPGMKRHLSNQFPPCGGDQADEWGVGS
ncbi:hypothetical protein ColTof3_05916 [Colletotrichum tofieldiae]|nr:hypothetical protein ColTof3_05916 [Colletotrichum tofieldiae]GKT84675.1 hypothetical protein Ct61P_02525 [Colletotrichum tofieldiae]